MSKDEEIAQLKETIAAEREKASSLEQAYSDLAHALAAAVEALKSIREAVRENDNGKIRYDKALDIIHDTTHAALLGCACQDRRGEMSDQDKPTAGEWTVDTVFNLLMSQEDDHLAHAAVADAHNAALAAERNERRLRTAQLAAEREKVHRCEVIHRHCETIELLKQQLAAQRDDRISWQELYEKTNDQLAAEREESAKWRSEASKTNELRQQLAAEERRANDSIEENVRLMNRLATAVAALKEVPQQLLESQKTMRLLIYAALARLEKGNEPKNILP